MNLTSLKLTAVCINCIVVHEPNFQGVQHGRLVQVRKGRQIIATN